MAINISINLEKIDKKYLVKGQKGNYLNIALIETPNNEYGDSHMAVQSLPKAVREADPNVKGNILGNAKTFGNKSAAPANNASEEQDPLPF
tara:strand:- start:42 stop:314 length:273 start_codon:yes stop_codon:yes gene_type:complete